MERKSGSAILFSGAVAKGWYSRNEATILLEKSGEEARQH